MEIIIDKVIYSLKYKSFTNVNYTIEVKTLHL